jgi:transketolase
MRAAFIRTLVEIAGNDRRILLLTGDLGYMAVEPFAEKFPERFFNVGVAEQDLVGLATGLAESGFIPFVYSIVPFAVLRPYEFIRNGPILHQFPVRIAGMGGGLEYGMNGATHYGLEDVGVLRIQPGITVIAPADCEQARTALLATWSLPGPVYYRLSKDDRTIVPGLGGKFELGHVQSIRLGTDLVMVAMGSIAIEALRAVEMLATQGISCTLLVIASLNPAPVADLVEALSSFRVAMTVEAHYVVGGVGSLVSEIIAENGLPCRLIRCGIKSMPDGITGSLDYMLRQSGLTGDQLARTALEALHSLGLQRGLL